MAQRLNLLRAVVTAMALTLSATSTAQALTDPTRPPLELMRAAAAKAGGLAADAEPPRPRLEQILLSSERKGAIIDGHYVPLGGMHGKAALVNIDATSITLQMDKQREVIQLYPAKRLASGARGAGAKSEEAVKRP